MQIGHLGNRFGSLGGGNSNGWVLPGASVDMDFALGLYFGGSLSSLLSTTRAQTVSSYATTSKGLLVPFAANTPRITDQGLLVEQGSTNTALHSRDMTQASWVAVNMTAALNAVGADGVANSATTLTATAGNATILQALTIGSTTETYSVYLKRVSGTGTINISENGGSSWTPCTINSSTFTRCFVEASLANPSVGIQIVTNGDVIVADFNQNEALAFATSPIPTTTTSVARAADVVTAAGALLTALKGAAASDVIKVGPISNYAQFPRIIGGASSSAQGLPFVGTSATAIGVYNGTTSLTGTGGDISIGSIKIGVSWNGSGRSVVGAGGTVSTDANTQVSDGAGYVIGNAFNNKWIDGYIQRLTIWNSRLPDATLKSLTQ